MTEIVFAVAADGTPELAEEYYLSLTAVHTVSSDISPSGSAEIDPDASMATITLRASDNPHGVVEFQEISVLVESEESSPAVLTVIREFGSIGRYIPQLLLYILWFCVHVYTGQYFSTYT